MMNVIIGVLCFALNMKSGEATVVRNDSVPMLMAMTATAENSVVEVPDTIEQGGVTYRVTAIADGAFRNTYLTQVTLPKGIKKIGKSAFESVLNVRGAQLKAGETYGAKYQGKYAQGYLLYPNDSMTLVLDCNVMARGKVEVPETVRGIAVEAFKRCKQLNAVRVPLSVQEIGLNAFQGVPYVYYTGGALGAPWGAAVLDGNVFGIYAFADWGRTTLMGCVLTEPRELTVPEGVSYLSRSALEGYRHLRSVTLPASVQEIGSRAFYGCSNLRHVDLPAGLRYLAADAFDGCTVLDSLQLPAGCELTENQVPLKQQPQFQKGGSAGMRKWLDKHLKSENDSTRGRTLLQFYVAEDGSVSHAQVLLSCGDRERDEAVLRAVEAMPLWAPARDMYDRAVGVTCTVRM